MNGPKILDVAESRGALAAYRTVMGILLTVGTIFLNDIRTNQRDMLAAVNAVKADTAGQASRIITLERRADETEPMARENRDSIREIKTVMRERGGIRFDTAR